jgi:hypothetical protein
MTRPPSKEEVDEARRGLKLLHAKMRERSTSKDKHFSNIGQNIVNNGYSENRGET